MNLGNVNYNLDQESMSTIHTIRRSLFTGLYSNQLYINDLIAVISRYIELLSIDYSATDFTITIKIKKTTMKKVHGFCHDPNFYYNIIANIFREYIQTHENILINALQFDNHCYGKEEQFRNILQTYYSNNSLLANLCHIVCMGDNVLVIKL